jgi:hypothetical protein
MSVIPPRAPTIADPVTAVMPEIGETLRVTNISTLDTYRFAWNSRQYVIPPTSSEFMPFDAVKVYTGDPRATNNVRTSRDSIGIVSFLPDRATEVRRLRLLYAAPFGEYMRASDVGGIFVNSHPTIPNEELASKFAWEGVRIPQIEVYNIRGDRIFTVLDDPEGAMTIPITVTRHDLNSNDHLHNLIQQQATLIDTLSQRLGIDPNSPALDNTPDLLNEPPPEEHEDGTPKMVFDPASDTVRPKRRSTTPDPTDINDLPEDRI